MSLVVVLAVDGNIVYRGDRISLSRIPTNFQKDAAHTGDVAPRVEFRSLMKEPESKANYWPVVGLLPQIDG